jgi:hypothetical protein
MTFIRCGNTSSSQELKRSSLLGGFGTATGRNNGDEHRSPPSPWGPWKCFSEAANAERESGIQSGRLNEVDTVAFDFR